MSVVPTDAKFGTSAFPLLRAVYGIGYRLKLELAFDGLYLKSQLNA